jgi:CheY-like chemotaxis protein
MNHEVEILLVEDNPDDAKLVIQSLKENHLANNLVHLKDGGEALDFIFARGPYEQRDAQEIPRVILLDLKMPKIDGLEVLKQLKANEKTKAIPIVIMTSSENERDLMESRSLGVNSYVVKPVEFGSFAKIVAELGMYWLLLNERIR